MSTQYEPLGGQPGLIREDTANIPEKTLEARGFATTNIVNISDIMEKKKKENLFIAFGSDEESGVDFKILNMFDDKPHEYERISYKKY